MKNNKGITMIILVITIVVMAIIGSIVVTSGSKELKEVELQDLVTNMLLIQAKAKIGIEEVKFQTANLNEDNEEDLVKINQIKDDNLIGTRVGQEIELSDYLGSESDANIDWYYLTNDDLDKIGLYNLKNVNGENVYYIYGFSKESSNIEIIYTGGYTHTDKTVYYKLSDLEERQLS